MERSENPCVFVTIFYRKWEQEWYCRKRDQLRDIQLYEIGQNERIRNKNGRSPETLIGICDIVQSVIKLQY